MIPRLLELVWLMSRSGSSVRRPSLVAGACTSSIDGMLFVGVRPAPHHAA